MNLLIVNCWFNLMKVKQTKNLIKWSAKACFYCSIKISLRHRTKYKLGDQGGKKHNINVGAFK